MIPGATWSPEYDVTITKNTDNKATATLTTSISHSSINGRKIEQAQIVLTTAKPNLGSIPPYPRTILVDGEEKMYTKKY